MICLRSTGGGAPFSDNKRFGVLWMGRDALAHAFRMEGAFNDLALTLSRGASGAEVIAVGHRNQYEAEIVNGLTRGETVVLHPSNQLDDGMRVRGI